MTIVVEDGSEVAGANSYGTRAGFIAWALQRGYTIADDVTADSYLVKSFDFIRGLEHCLLGHLMTKTQTGAYPRYGLYINGFVYANDEIPQVVKDWQFSLALDINNGIDIHNPKPSASVAVKRVRVEGAVEKEFAVSDQSNTVYQSLSQTLQAQLCRSSGLGVSISMG